MVETLTAREKIKDYISTNSISQKDLAILINENPVYLSEILNGTKNGPKANEKILKIIKVLGIR